MVWLLQRNCLHKITAEGYTCLRGSVLAPAGLHATLYTIQGLRKMVDESSLRSSMPGASKSYISRYETGYISMIQHVMLWNYRDEVHPDERARLQAHLEALPSRVPALLSVQWGPVFGGRNHSFSHCFVMLFNDREGLSEYTVHPDHARFAVAFKEACAVQVVADFEVENHYE